MDGWSQTYMLKRLPEPEGNATGLNTAAGQWVRGNILEGENGTVHYSFYLPEGYDGTQKFPLIVTLPGYGGMWFGPDSEGNNLRETGVSVWTELDEPLIVVSPQVED